jgi:thioredoxin reductase/Pyruvate/2-oxoacid:ferredoxin oxidoreductase delta subunit
MTWKEISITLGKYASAIGVVVFGGVGFIAFWRHSRALKKATKVYQDAVKTNTHEPISLHPDIDPAKCAGCGACTKACPEGDILQLINHKAVLVGPSQCVGHGQCEVACPFGAISLVFGTKSRGMELPRVSTNFETNLKGLYIAGELGGMGLIRNAVKQGRMAAEHAASHLNQQNQRHKADLDLLVIGAGPAGLAAGLTAVSQKISYACIEQNSFGGTIYNFPRQKVVMTHPADLPLIGPMKFPQNKVSKEQLLDFWNKVRKQTGLNVMENCKFLTLTQQGSVYNVQTSKGLVTARKVVLAMGVRGSPRKLGLPNEDLPKVTYNLLEPDQYQNQDVTVVGGGNAGVEAAQQLANPRLRNRVSLLVRGEVFDRCNMENQTIIKEMASKNLLKIHYNSSIKEIHANHLVVEKDKKIHDLKNSYLFVFIGAEVPFKFLQSLGVQIEKKFGEAIRKS